MESDDSVRRLDFQDELANQRKETIQMAILAKEMAAIGKMSLSELRTLDPDAPIIEKDEEPLPGAGAPAPDAGMPAMDAGMPAMDAGMPAMDAGMPAMDAGAPPGGPEAPLPPM